MRRVQLPSLSGTIKKNRNFYEPESNIIHNKCKWFREYRKRHHIIQFSCPERSPGPVNLHSLLLFGVPGGGEDGYFWPWDPCSHCFISEFGQFLLLCFCCYFDVLQFTFLMSSNEDGHFLMFMFPRGRSKQRRLPAESIRNDWKLHLERCYGRIRTNGSIRIIRGLCTPTALSEASVPASRPTFPVWSLYFHRKVSDSGCQSWVAPTIMVWRRYLGSFCREIVQTYPPIHLQEEIQQDHLHIAHTLTHTLSI